MKKVLSCLLAVMLFLTCIPTAMAVDNARDFFFELINYLPKTTFVRIERLNSLDHSARFGVFTNRNCCSKWSKSSSKRRKAQSSGRSPVSQG